MEKKISDQKSNFTSSVFQLKIKEIKESQSCSCRGYCNISHKKHNFVKSRSEELFLNMKSFSECHDILSHTESIADHIIKKRYTCNQCGNEFSKQGDLKRHYRSEH